MRKSTMSSAALRCLAASLGIVFCLGLPGHAGAQEQLVIQSWGGTNLDILKKIVIDPFEKKTNIKVEVRIQQNTFDGLTKLQAQRNAPAVDLWNTSAVPAMIAHKDGLGIPLDKSKIANMQYVADALFRPECLAWEQYIFGLMYNKDTVPFEIKKWEDLWDPRLKGKIAVPNPANAEGKFLVLLTWLAGGGEASPDGGFALAMKLRPNVATYYKSFNERNRALETGEASVGAFGLPSEYIGLAKGNPQFRFVAPEPYVPTDANCFSLVKGSKNVEAAYKFIDFALSKDIQEAFTAERLSLPVNRTAAITDAVKPYVPDSSKFRYPDAAIVKDALPKWIERWDQQVQAQ